ncbi:RNA-directed RNA polymerase [Pseudozyma hubeiensis]|nr:RNA-directed RNA polymerase [Pseudozyma hubeiensis]
MDVFIGSIPKHFDSAKLENFILDLVRNKCNLTTASTSLALTAVTVVPLNKGFYFKQIPWDDHCDIGFITFARRKVAEWFIERTRSEPLVKLLGLDIKPGRRTPSKAFVRAIAENASEQEPSASAQKQHQSFLLDSVRIGHWAAKFRFCFTHYSSGGDISLTVGEQGVVSIDIDSDKGLSFLTRDVRSFGVRQDQAHHTVLLELKQNPLLYGGFASATGSKYHFDLPSRVISIDFGSEKHSIFTAQRLSNILGELLSDTPKIKMRQVQTVPDSSAALIHRFFRRSPDIDIELAFLRESLLRNELVGTSILSTLTMRLDQLIARGQQNLALRTLKNLITRLEARQERAKTEEQEHQYTLRQWNEAAAEAVKDSASSLLTFFEPSRSRDDSLLSPFLHVDVTPTRILLSGPFYHMSNRVIRSYRAHWHHFARVTFTNESREGATTITPNYGFSQSEEYILNRVMWFLAYGINIAGRHWDLLAWSSSSMSTHTVWFITPFNDETGRRIDANVIRNSLGDFKDVIRSPALYGARLSQAFSATASTVQIPEEHMKKLKDIVTYNEKHAKQIHTDGVGQISPELMGDVWESYVSTHGEHRKRKLLKALAPSAIQIRLGGSKGMLAVNPRLSGKVLYIRPSMFKFSSRHQALEVANSSTRCLSAKLNRPLINALDSRGVSVQAFLEIQQEAISQIGRARSKFDETARLCSAFSFGTGCNLRVLFEKIHKAGIGPTTVEGDSFFLVLAKAAAAAALGDMKRKARIPVKGVTLLGVADEFAYLKEGEIFVQVETAEFGQVSRRILSGRKLIGRSPTIDPSDVTMVECRKPPPGHPLLQLRNVVVFNTCTRNQPLPRRLGGGDLDGDLYTVYEDERLFPTSIQPNSVFHDKVRPRVLDHDCKPYDLAEFFTDFMLNDFIGLVSHLHLRISDASELGAEASACKDLAVLHSQATDFRKTGVAVTRAQLPRMEEPILPDFLAQAEKHGRKRDGKLVYSSERVLGHMYRAVSWGETDTPSLDANTDPETGLERVSNEEWTQGDASEFEEDFRSIVDPEGQSVSTSLRATLGAKTAAAISAAGSVPDVAGLEPTQGPLATRSADSDASLQTGNCCYESSVDAAPWSFKDCTFPQFFERIGWTNEGFLASSKDDKEVVAEGHRYVGLFQTFTRHLRYLSRHVAMHHPDHGKIMKRTGNSDSPLEGMYLISEVHLLTGPLPWARVAKRTRSDRDSDLLDRMQSICTMLRKRLCRISEADHFGPQEDSDQQTAADTSGFEDVLGASQSLSTDASQEHQRSEAAEHTDVLLPSSIRVVDGDGSASISYELKGSDEDITPDASKSRSSTPRPLLEGSLLATITNTVDSGSGHPVIANGLKRKASQEAAGSDKRDRSLLQTHSPVDVHESSGPSDMLEGSEDSASTPKATYSTLSPERHILPPTLPPTNASINSSLQIIDRTDSNVRSGDMIPLDDTDDGTTTEADYESEPEEGELTVESAQRTVDSLWRACHFFCSPQRPRYSNLYGYNTFMITLTLHLLSTLETLKHLHRDQIGGVGRRYFQRPSGKGKAPVRTEQDPYDDPLEQFDEDEEYEYDEEEMMENDDRLEVDDGYSLTEETMRALNLGQMLMDDMAPSLLGFDG